MAEQPPTEEKPTEEKFAPTHGAFVSTSKAQGRWVFHGFKRDPDKEGGFDTAIALLSADGKGTDRFFEAPSDSLKAFAEPDISLRDKELQEDLARPVPGAKPPARGVTSASEILPAILIAFALFLNGCGAVGGLSTTEQTQLAATGSSIASIVINAAVKYGIANAASKLHGNPYADSAAAALWSLSGQDAVTQEQIAQAITAMGDPKKKASWQAFGNEVGNSIVRYGAATSVKAATDAAAIAVAQLGHSTPPAPRAPTA